MDKCTNNVFNLHQHKDQKVSISWHGRQVLTLKGKNALKLLAKIHGASDEDAQLIMAKATGNFKRGNERK